ncbi:biotin synthase auxiliary protein BsaP [Arthrobacter methylotrophus]|uniref:biotin synthase auxiliary protein BsaP n=1 Tax=Arthrobacter methylotrophus TaxID=121291 RepID=UPI00406BCE60
MNSEATANFCGHCGAPAPQSQPAPQSAPAPQGERPTSDAHQDCQRRLAMEPPRYCAVCRRRMKVQVTPLGWTAECSRHGRLVP